MQKEIKMKVEKLRIYENTRITKNTVIVSYKMLKRTFMSQLYIVQVI